ncbi:MAG: prepilin-type N-terminal cleavage/methylation domain-containing protein [Colwellia sp.]|nr:prepilin-type N-terminal cleavage/methylation domain-containing protein [Colwellia sp.]
MVSSRPSRALSIPHTSNIRPKIHANRGFTLIELMLATSLLMMVMFSGYYAYSLYSQKWQKRVQVFWHNTEQSTALDSLHKVISSAIPYIVNGQDDKAVIYFKGTNTQVSFISNSAVFSNEPALVQLNIEAMAGSNHYNLIYREQSIQHNLVLDIAHQPQWQHEVILLSNIANFNLSFFGWERFGQAVEHVNSDAFVKEDTRTWYQNHESNVSRLLPEKIQVRYSSAKGENGFELALSQHSLFSLLTYMREGA